MTAMTLTAPVVLRIGDTEEILLGDVEVPAALTVGSDVDGGPTATLTAGDAGPALAALLRDAAERLDPLGQIENGLHTQNAAEIRTALGMPADSLHDDVVAKARTYRAALGR